MATKIFEGKFKVKYDWFKNTMQMISEKSFSSGVISARLRRYEDYFIQLTEAYESILVSVSDDSIVQDYDNKYKDATELYNQVDAISARYPNLDGTHQATESYVNTRLPTINLINFDGDIYSWPSFYSLYLSLVLTRKDISKTEKFHYLISHLEKEPRTLIKHLPAIDESLDSALDILKGRYENKRLLADSNLTRILNLPTLKNVNGLRVKILNPLLECTRALKNLGLPIEHWSYILLHVSLCKLPLDTKTRFEQVHGMNAIVLPTFDQLIDFLQNECRLLDTSTESSINLERTTKVRAVHVLNRESENLVINTGCLYCNTNGHGIYKCFQFRTLTNVERKDWVRNKGLCFKCFGRHSAVNCNRSTPCDNCGNIGHNKMICLNNSHRRTNTCRSPAEDRGHIRDTHPRADVTSHTSCGHSSRNNVGAVHSPDTRRDWRQAASVTQRGSGSRRRSYSPVINPKPCTSDTEQRANCSQRYSPGHNIYSRNNNSQ